MVKKVEENDEYQMSTMFIEYLMYPFFKLLLMFWYFPVMLIGMCRRKQICVPLNEPPEVTKTSATNLAKQIANKEVTCRFVIESYIARMKEVNPVINAIVEQRFDAALKDADAVDAKIKNSNKTARQWLEEFPLLGVPLTVKESIGVKGMSQTAGYFLAAGRLCSQDADIVVQCVKSGAIVLAISNTPELCMNWETYNNLVGTTKNPYDSRRTCGGSSGGEGALLGSGASVIGLGSDVAGSLRFPAHYCGIFSHKPTAGVVSTVGHFPTCADEEKWNAHFTLGPMCRYAEDLLPMMKILVRDDFKSTLNLSNEVDISKVKIYYLKDFGSVLCSGLDSEISVAMDFTLDHFKIKHNLQVQPLDKNFFKNSLIPVLLTLLQIKGVEYERPKSIFAGLLKVIFKCSDINFNTYFYGILELFASTVSESTFTKCNAKVDRIRNQLEILLGDDGVLIMPTFCRPADYHYTTTPRLMDTLNAIVWNSLGMPVTCCPIGWHSKELPFGVQVISKRFNDKLSIAVAEEIENICGGWRLPHCK